MGRMCLHVHEYVCISIFFLPVRLLQFACRVDKNNAKDKVETELQISRLIEDNYEHTCVHLVESLDDKLNGKLDYISRLTVPTNTYTRLHTRMMGLSWRRDDRVVVLTLMVESL